MDIRKTGKRIKEIRESKHMRQKHLAEKLEISDKYLSAVERGIRKPSIELIVRIANVFEIGTDDILCDSLKKYEKYHEAQMPERVKMLSAERQKRVQKLVDVLIENDLV